MRFWSKLNRIRSKPKYLKASKFANTRKEFNPIIEYHVVLYR
jgi:hypothetical protein